MKTPVPLRLLGLLVAAAAVSACGGATLIVNGGPPKLDGPLRAIATTSNHPRFANQLVAQLNALGYSALDANASSAVISQAGGPTVASRTINQIDDPDVLARLRALKVDVLMAVEVKTSQSVIFGVTREFFEGVKVTLYSMSNPGPTGGFDWKNSWGGMEGSLADGVMRQSEPAAAQQLAGTVAKLVGPPGPRVTIDPGIVAAPVQRKRRKYRKEAPLEGEAAPATEVAAGQLPPGEPAPANEVASATPAAPEAAAEPPRPLSADEAGAIDEELLP